MDTGKSFRNNELLGYLLLELAEQNIHGNSSLNEVFKVSIYFVKLTLVNLNYFAEKHGKNARDAHFSKLAQFIKAESLIRRLRNSQDIVDAIISRQNMANENNPSIVQVF